MKTGALTTQLSPKSPSVCLVLAVRGLSIDGCLHGFRESELDPPFMESTLSFMSSPHQLPVRGGHASLGVCLMVGAFLTCPKPWILPQHQINENSSSSRCTPRMSHLCTSSQQLPLPGVPGVTVLSGRANSHSSSRPSRAGKVSTHKPRVVGGQSTAPETTDADSCPVSLPPLPFIV